MKRRKTLDAELSCEVKKYTITSSPLPKALSVLISSGVVSRSIGMYGCTAVQLPAKLDIVLLLAIAGFCFLRAIFYLISGKDSGGNVTSGST